MRFTSPFLFLLLGACGLTPDEQFAKLRNEVPSVIGGYRYQQYVVVGPGDQEVLGDEGVLYISSTMFTDVQLKHIEETQPGKAALEMAGYSPADGLLNMCFSAQSRGKGKAGSAGGYSSLVITWARDVKGETKITLYSWPDAWYDWYLKRTDGQVVAEDPAVQNDFGWQSSRIVLTPDPSVDLDKCLHYRDGS